MLLLLLGCFWHYPLVPTTTAPVATTTSAQDPEPPPITFSPLEEKLEIIFTSSTDADQRDRLSNLRELLHAMRAKDPVAQRRVYDFADGQLRIEARGVPQPLPVEEGLEPIVPIVERPILERPVGTPDPPPGLQPEPPPDPLSPGQQPIAERPLESTPFLPMPVAPTAADLLGSARSQFSAAAYIDAISTLAPLTSPEAAALRKEAVDAWARSERESAGAEFITARSLAAGPARTEALVKARDHLAAINARFPDNNFAAAIADNIVKVNAELAP